MTTNKEIREYLGHNGRECCVVIRRNGEVHRFGSPDTSNRSGDFWAYMGYRDELAEQIAWESSTLTQLNKEI